MNGIVVASFWLVQVVRSGGSKRTAEIVSISGPGSNDPNEFHEQLLEAAKERFGSNVVDVEKVYYRKDD